MRFDPTGMTAQQIAEMQALNDRLYGGGNQLAESQVMPQTATYTSGGEYPSAPATTMPATPATIMYDRSQSGIPISNEEFMAVTALSRDARTPRQSGFMPPAPGQPQFYSTYSGAMGIPNAGLGRTFNPYGFGRPPMGAGKGGYRPPMYGGFGGGFGRPPMYGPPQMGPMKGSPRPPLYGLGGQRPFGGGRMAAPGFNTATGTFDSGFNDAAQVRPPAVQTATNIADAGEPIMENAGISSFGGANQPTNPYSMGYGMGFRQQQPMGGGKGGSRSAGGKGGAQ